MTLTKAYRTQTGHQSGRRADSKRTASGQKEGSKAGKAESSTILKLHTRDEREAAVDAVMIAANRGMQDNPAIGDAYQPIPISHGSRQSVFDWLADGIPVSVAEATVYRRAKEYQPDGRRTRITTMNYFTAAVADAFDRHKAQHAEIPTDANHGAGTGGQARGGTAPKRDKFAHLTESGGGDSRLAG